MTKFRNFPRANPIRTLSEIVAKECPKDELRNCRTILLDYTFRTSKGNEEAYLLVSVGNWRGREFFTRFKSLEPATAVLNEEAAAIRQYLGGQNLSHVKISCYYLRGAGEGKEVLVCENWPGK